MNANEGLFFNACDTFGRGQVQAYMEEMFKKVQEQYAVQQEKEAHTAQGGTTH